MISNQEVVVHRTFNPFYPKQGPFHPDCGYPEYRFEDLSAEPNPVYDAVRACFYLAGFEKESYGTDRWNPLKGLIKPGDKVMLKPNLISEKHHSDPNGWQYVLTHGSVIRAVADYVWIALEGRGQIVLADAPQHDSSFGAIVRILQLDKIQEFYNRKGLDFNLLDLRKEEWVNKDGVIVSRNRLSGDPLGYIPFNLGKYSEFSGHRGCGRYYGADYDTEEVNYHHTQGRHEYLIARSAVQCDVLINLPKLKTHKKAGITVSLKNLVGVSGDKNWLPHHTEGNPSQGGDEHPEPGIIHRIERQGVHFVRKTFQRMPWLGLFLHRKLRSMGSHIFGDSEAVIRSGNWWGNDTVWRMCLDMNKIIYYGNEDGTLRPSKPENRKRHFVLVDGIISGEGRGPINVDPVSTGLLIFGLNPASVDAASAYLMGFDPDKIPIVRQAFRCKTYPLAEWEWPDIQVLSNIKEWNGYLPDIKDETTFHFEPHFGWKGHIERKSILKIDD